MDPDEQPVEIDWPARRAEIEAEFRTFVQRHRTVMADIIDERIRQDMKWGIVSGQAQTLDRRQVILDEEVGEAANALLELKANGLPALREELIQVAAVAVATVEAIDRDEWPA